MGWVNAGILTGLAALAVPIVIHLLRSRRFRVARLGSNRFLQQVLRETARWRRLQNLLLLLARLLVVALLTLLFARPFLRDPADAEEQRQEAVVLLDTSGSMAGESLGVTNLILARERTDRVLDDLPKTAGVTVAAFADGVREIDGLADAELHAAGRTGYADALIWARDRLALSEATTKRVVLVSDCQNAGLPAEPLHDWPLDVGVELVPVAAPGSWNAGVVDVRNLCAYMGREGAIQVAVACYGDTPDAETMVELSVEGAGTQQMTIPLRTGLAEFEWSPAAPGVYRGVVRVHTDDAYQRDNERHFSFRVQRPARILLVNGDPGRTAYDDETYYLEAALRVASRDGGQSPFQPEVRTELGSLDGVAVVALCNVGELAPAEIRRLSGFVGMGGSLVYFLGDQVTATFYGQLHRARLLPGRLTALRVAIPRQVAEWDREHPALRLFSTRQKGDLGRIVFRDSFRLELDSGAKVLATLTGDEPAVVEEAMGRGTVVLIVNPCDRNWSNWPSERVFLPLMRELFHYLARKDDAESSETHVPAGIDEPETGPADEASTRVVYADPAEVDTRCLTDEDTFRKALGVGPAPAPPEGEAADTDLPAGRKRENEVWQVLAWALLAVMFVENTMADRGSG